MSIDDVTVVSGDFHVEGQHNWINFPLSMRPGEHEIVANSDSGADLRETFTVRAKKTDYAVIDYWGEDDSADLSWDFQREPIGFA